MFQLAGRRRNVLVSFVRVSLTPVGSGQLPPFLLPLAARARLLRYLPAIRKPEAVTTPFTDPFIPGHAPYLHAILLLLLLLVLLHKPIRGSPPVLRHRLTSSPRVIPPARGDGRMGRRTRREIIFMWPLT